MLLEAFVNQLEFGSLFSKFGLDVARTKNILEINPILLND